MVISQVIPKTQGTFLAGSISKVLPYSIELVTFKDFEVCMCHHFRFGGKTKVIGFNSELLNW